MNPQKISPSEEQGIDEGPVWRLLGRWWMIAFVSIAILVVTLNPLLAGVLPYLRAGWPAVKTEFWLKRVDPWATRGTVCLLFHLCMAGFCAGACGAAFVFLTIIASAVADQEADLNRFMIAIAFILLSCLLSVILGWIGIAISMRHGIRIYVAARLYSECREDFNVARTLEHSLPRTNPARYILAIATVVPLLTLWFAAMLLTIPRDGNKPPDVDPSVVLLLLPVISIACIVFVVRFSSRIMANTPAECWGAQIPQFDEDSRSWYQMSD